jgi:hypothetical protein
MLEIQPSGGVARGMAAPLTVEKATRATRVKATDLNMVMISRE